MKKRQKEILVSVDEFEIRAALLDERRLVEYYAEEIDQRSIVGNIYLGQVKDILPGMEAAFIDIGLERNAFLFIDDLISADADIEGSGSNPKIQNLLKVNQKIMVQIAREPVEKKGARVSAQLSLPGRKLVLMPYGKSVGVSKKLPNGERERLHDICQKIKPDNQGLIVRTAAESATTEELTNDLNYLSKLWHSLTKRREKSVAPALIYNELDLANRIIRDVFGPDYARLQVDDEEKYQDIITLVDKTIPELEERIYLYGGTVPLFERYEIDSQLETALSRRVWLRSGGYIAIDSTEALTSIDVNTAKNIGTKSLEETIFKNNLEAAEEIVRQLRLRDIGGIIVIDFIDMQQPGHREAVFDAFNRSLESDRKKSRVIEISKLGLVEMTRKSTSKGVQAYFYDKCLTCGGTGLIVSVHRAGLTVLRKMKRSIKNDGFDAYVFDVSPEVKMNLESDHLESIETLKKKFGKQIIIREDKTMKPMALKVTGEHPSNGENEGKKGYKKTGIGGSID